MVEALIGRALGTGVRAARRLGGGCVAEVWRVELSSGETVVAKVDRGEGAALDVEAFMLRYLAEHSALPVPAVHHASAELLVMGLVEGSTGASGRAEEHAAELLAALHGVTAPRYGFECDTLIGALRQPNPASARWLPFFAEHRLVYMACEASAAGRLPVAEVRRVERVASRLERWLEEPERPSLLHGDVWSGNVLSRQGRVTGFVDPAVYYGDPEIELAFTTLFSTFGERFFTRYRELRPLREGFFEQRRYLYNLYPLLVHARLFGGGYQAQVAAVLDRFV